MEFKIPFPGSPGFRFKKLMRALEKQLILYSLARNESNIAKTSRFLGLNRTTLSMKIRKLKLKGFLS